MALGQADVFPFARTSWRVFLSEVVIRMPGLDIELSTRCPSVPSMQCVFFAGVASSIKHASYLTGLVYLRQVTEQVASMFDAPKTTRREPDVSCASPEPRARRCHRETRIPQDRSIWVSLFTDDPQWKGLKPWCTDDPHPAAEPGPGPGAHLRNQ